MNQGRIWCVVNPTVGLPLFIGGVAVTSLVVHASVMTHTAWVSNFWNGGAAKTRALYFVARSDGGGGTVFSESLADHNRAVNQFQRGGKVSP